MREKIVHELKSAGLATVFFLFWFGLLGLFKQLFLAEYHIEFYGFMRALVGAALMAKIVIILDNTAIGQPYPTHPRYIGILIKTMVYSVAASFATILERWFHMYREFHDVGTAWTEVYGQRDIHHFLATLLAIMTALLFFNVFSEISRYLGHGGLFRLFFSPRAASVSDREPSRTPISPSG